MSKIVDITEKLNFEERPKIIIKGTEIDINNDAVSVLKLTALLSDEGTSVKDAITLFEVLFDEENRKKVEDLHLNWDDFNTFLGACANIVIGDDEDTEGETQTPATT